MTLRLDGPKCEEGDTEEDVDHPDCISRLCCSCVAEGFWSGGLPEMTAGLVTNTCVH